MPYLIANMIMGKIDAEHYTTVIKILNQTINLNMPHKLTRRVIDATSFDPAESMLPFTASGVLVGWLRPDFAPRLEAWTELFSVKPRGVSVIGDFPSVEHRSAAIAEVVESLAAQEVIRGWRDEKITIAESFYAPSIFYIERAASLYFGLTVYASHLNALVMRNGVAHMWLARRAANKHQDPGKLDNIAAGRIARGFSPWETLVKESFEEAGIVERFTKNAKSTGAIKSIREVDEGLHHEIIFTHDIVLPESFTPQNQDGEVAEFLCVPISEIMTMLEDGADFTVDAMLVIVDCLIRHAYITAERDDYLELIRGMKP
jgi:8-oxo-dGTP pyrophosphatase MutT (NUDIX family)